MDLRGWSNDLQQTQDVDGGHIEFCYMLISPYRMEMLAQKMQHDHMEMPKWPKVEPYVTSHDVISWTTGTNLGLFLAIIQDIFIIFDTELKKQPSWRNVPDSFIMKIQDGGGRHIEFRKT